MAADGDLVLMTVAAGVATITFNRPERQNAWMPAMTDRYVEALEACERDPAVRAIVVTGAGGHWSSGGDGAVLDELADHGAIDGGKRRPIAYRAMLIDKPVIAAISGVCFGVGLFHALCCDIRFAAEDVKFSTAFARRGLPAEAGTSWLLPRAVGQGQAADLLYSARVVRASEALRVGLVSSIVAVDALLEETLAYARGIAEHCSPASLRTMKRQLYEDETSSFADAFARAEALTAVAIVADDFREGVASWRTRRPPVFASLDGISRGDP